MIARKGMVLALVGPAGGGKTSLGDRLLKDYGASIRLSISATTRAPRAGERDGESYYFISRADFDAKVKRDELFEWEEIHGNCYGTLRRTIDDAVSSGIDLLLDVDIRGALTFKRRLPEQTVICFLVPPSPEALRDRVLKRAKTSEEELTTRLSTAKREYEQLLEHTRPGGMVDYLVVNDVFDDAYRAVRAIVDAERVRLARLDVQALRKVCVI